MYEVRYLKQGTEPKFAYIKHMNMNEGRLPIPYSVTTVHEFRHQFSNWTPSYVEYRTITIRKTRMSAKIFYFHDVAYAMVFDSKWHLNKEGKKVYNKPILYYKIGCEHDYKELSTEQCAERNLIHYGMCWHVYACDKCGMIEAQDSSG
jgi:hypothetical protein